MYEIVEQYKGHDITAHGNGFTVFIGGDEFYEDSIQSAKHLIDTVVPEEIKEG